MNGDGRDARTRSLFWIGYALVCCGAFIRASVILDPMPLWADDPSEVLATFTGLGPSGLILLDLLTLVGCASLLWSELRRDRSIDVLLAGAIGLGALAVLGHIWLFDGFFVLAHAKVGLPWIAAMATGLAIGHACRDARIQRITVAIAIGFVGMLFAKGAYQVFVENPLTVQEYRSNREAFLRSKGWKPDSPQALGFERRLNQPDATGWFGLANVYGSFAAAATTTFLVLLVLALRTARERLEHRASTVCAGLAAGAIVAGCAVVMSRSKGAVAALLLAALVTLGVFVLKRARPALVGRSWFGPAVALGCIGATLAGVVARGLVGERIGELSILFRWFYAQGAVRIFGSEPLTGVGPAGFKDAYLVNKPPLSPEEITSPHSVMLDLVATLGVAGFAWIAVLCVWVVRCGRSLLPPESPEEASGATFTSEGGRTLPIGREDLLIVGALAAVPTFLSSWLEAESATPEGSIARIGGIVLWVGLAGAAMALMRVHAGWRVGAAAGALALVIQAQIEVTPVLASSAPLFMLMLCAAGPASESRRRGIMSMVPVGLAGVAAWCLFLGWVPGRRWQQELVDAEALVRPAAELSLRLRVIESGGSRFDSLERLDADLARLAGLGAGRPSSRDERYELIQAVRSQGAKAALEPLSRASNVMHGDFATSQAYSKLLLQVADAEARAGSRERARDHAELACNVAEEQSAGGPVSRAAALSWYGVVLEARAAILDNQSMSREALSAWERATALDPYGLSPVERLYEGYKRAYAVSGDDSDAGEAERWGRRLLELDDLRRLDVVTGLGSRRAAIERFIRSRSSGP